MTATSIGISAKVLADLGYLQRTEGKITLVQQSLMTSRVVLLSVVTGIAGGATLEPLRVIQIMGTSIGFWWRCCDWQLAMPFFLRVVRTLRTRVICSPLP